MQLLNLTKEHKHVLRSALGLLNVALQCGNPESATVSHMFKLVAIDVVSNDENRLATLAHVASITAEFTQAIDLADTEPSATASTEVAPDTLDDEDALVWADLFSRLQAAGVAFVERTVRGEGDSGYEDIVEFEGGDLSAGDSFEKQLRSLTDCFADECYVDGNGGGVDITVSVAEKKVTVRSYCNEVTEVEDGTHHFVLGPAANAGETK